MCRSESTRNLRFAEVLAGSESLKNWIPIIIRYFENFDFSETFEVYSKDEEICIFIKYLSYIQNSKFKSKIWTTLITIRSFESFRNSNKIT